MRRTIVVGSARVQSNLGRHTIPGLACWHARLRTKSVLLTHGVRCELERTSSVLRAGCRPTRTTRWPSHTTQPRRSEVATSSGDKSGGGAGNSSPSSTWRLAGTGGAIGLAMGFFGGLVGQGGGVVGIPMMTSLLGLTQHQAHGTSLVAVASTGVAGAMAYWQAGGVEQGVDMIAALILTGSAALLARLGAKASRKVSSPHLKRYMAFFMLVSSFSVAAKAYLETCHPGTDRNSSEISSDDSSTDDQKQITIPSPSVESFREKVAQLTPEYIAMIGAIGAATGFASGFLGVGGGLVMVPLLTLCTNMHQSQILGTSLLAMVIPSAIGSLTHLRLGHVSLPIVPAMVVGSLGGAYLGGKLSTNLTQTQQRAVVAGTLFTLAIKMLRQVR